MGEVSQKYSKIAIVLLNWNGKKYLEQFFPTLVKNSLSEETKIYVADNGSTDDSIAYLQENFPQINLILFSENYGFTGGYNKALQQIEATYYIIINSDIEVTPGWISPIIEFMDRNDNIAACQPKIRSYMQKDCFEYAGAAGGFIDKYGYPFCRGRILKVYEKDTGQYDNLKEVFWATGACMFVRANLFKEAGGFDNDFFAHMEEIDLCWRLKNNGYKIYYHPDSLVYHVGGGTLPNNSPKKLYLNYRNNLFLLYKNLHSSELFWILFQRLILDGASVILYLPSFKFRFVWSVFRAHLSFYRQLSKMRKKRMKKLMKLKQIEGIFQSSIIFNYFIKKRYYFRELKFRK